MTYKKQYCYTQKEIPKKDGTSRTLYVPHLALKVVQRWILKEILEKINVSYQAMAFVPKRNGLRVNAEYHKKNIFILEMDIKKFFGSIQKKQVFQLFCKIGYNTDVSAVLANLCIYEDVLPQLNGLCSRKDIVYTRYADDLSFSSNNRTKLNSIEKIVKYIVKEEGFEINEKKTRYLSNDVKKTITGITINNEEVHVDKALKKKIRAMIFNSIVNKDYTRNDKIKGSIAYVDSIEMGYKEKILNYIIQITEKGQFKNNIDIVNAYNKNKFFKSLPYMQYEESPFY